MEIIYFISLGIVAVLLAIGMVASRNTVHSALFMVGHLLCIALLYLSLAAEFLAVVQVTVYAGAIMVLFVFVITMLNPANEESPNRISNRLPSVIALALAFLVGVSLILRSAGSGVAAAGQSQAAGNGNLMAIGSELFTVYLLPFELTSLLLLVAMVASIVLAKHRA